MKTNTGRIWAIGPQPKKNQHLDYLLLSRLATSPTRLFFEESWSGIGEVAFEGPSMQESETNPPFEIKRLTYPTSRPGEQLFYTSAPLTHITAITSCHSRLEGVAAIVGLLLEYQDGRKRCVGQMRLDSLKGTVTVHNSTGIMFLLSPDKRKVLDLQVCYEVEAGGWIRMPWSGSLGWWFSGTGCKLRHELPA